MAKSFFQGATHSLLYPKYRPRYTDEIFKAIFDYCHMRRCDFNLAVDVACGSGQSTVPLTKYFKKVIGIDTSQSQIAAAKIENSKNVIYYMNDAEDLSNIESTSVDLVTCAQALHWFNKERFYAEVDRILKPNGFFVVYGYGNAQLDNDEATKLIDQNSYFYKDVLGPYWTDDRKNIENLYSSVELPYPSATRRDDFKLTKRMSVESFVGYLSSFSSYQKFKKKFPDETDLAGVWKRLSEIYGDDLPLVTWPVFMIFSSKSYDESID